PAAYAVMKLQDLRDIARELRLRDTEAANTLGRLRTAVEELSGNQSSLIVWMSAAEMTPARRDTVELWRQLRDASVDTVEAALDTLRARPHPTPEYGQAVALFANRWGHLKRQLYEEERRREQEIDDEGAVFRNTVVNPAITRVDQALEPIEGAIGAEAEQRVERAREVSSRALSSAGAALAVALVLTLVIGTWLTRSLLRPVGELRRGMAHVAEGDFEPDVRVPADRPDELGDLARSFRTMTEQLAELDRLKAEFVSVASHEIKTPLSVIRGYVALLADGIYGPVNEQQKKTLKSVSDQTDRLTRLVHRLLDISRFEAGGGRLELRPIVLRDFFADLTDDFRVLAVQNGIQFPVTLARDLPETIVGDPDRLNEVLGNLLSNAFKFTAQGGTIRVEAHRDGSGIVVEVEDTGVGIPEDKLPRIFEKFFQVENEAQPRAVGSGLGLAIAREIVEAHGGTITAESEVGVGTRFRVVLPERPPAQRAP
ncbi:MAG TPA: HAMP domain-containing sensor histidine kinase, partial [Longimicrobiaceae bacterium]|nr:HAMP domain-containing sensor histidine kinase [Longimicrobiaceae bacterium]